MSARNNPLYTNPNLCLHLSDYKLRHGIDGYNSFQNLFKTIQNGKTRIKKHQKQIPRCSFCKEHQGRLYICLICSSISCSSHTLSHTDSNTGHDVAVDIERSELYCCSCSDQVYDPDFDKVVVSKQIMNLGIMSKSGFDLAIRRSSKKRKLESGIKSDLSRSKLLLSLRDRRAKWLFPLGLRGLNNLGSTCFMNSVLQALFHAPPLKNYLLSDQHNRDLCQKRSVDRLCLICDLDTIFFSMFSGDRTPYSPAQFLYSWWQHSANLANYEQQDSHEFFISLLDGIHENEGKFWSPQKDYEDCDCITHKAFSGLLRSDVTCMTCGSTSTTFDPFIDISLTLDTNDNNSFSKDLRRNISGETSDNKSVSTLSACLDFFTRSEKLGPDQKLHCQNCQERKDSSKQLSIRRLPSVLCLHIKRFEHSLVRKTSRKIDHYLQFPFHLDMSPYLSSSVLRSRFGNRIFAFDGDSNLDNSSAEFEIFAVIAHSGMLEAGHYVTYLQLKGQWYKCDDAWINEVDEDVVRASQCYMLFYVQKMVIHKTYEELSCLPISSAKDPFLPIAGCC